jgi:hypothetical protein
MADRAIVATGVHPAAGPAVVYFGYFRENSPLGGEVIERIDQAFVNVAATNRWDVYSWDGANYGVIGANWEATPSVVGTDPAYEFSA